MSQRFCLSAHWTQMLPSSSSSHLQSIQQKFMAPLCSSELQEKGALLTWKRWEEQQEQKCCQLPFRERSYQEARAVHGMIRVAVTPVSSSAPAVVERKGWSSVDVRGAFLLPRAPAAPHQPLSGWAVLQLLLCQALPWAAQGSTLKHPTEISAKRCLKKISLQKHCICVSLAGVLHITIAKGFLGADPAQNFRCTLLPMVRDILEKYTTSSK